MKLETLNWKSDEFLKNPDSRGDFYICYSCKKHWPRSAAIMKVTARDSVKPRGKVGL